jgi:hypothetical protein
MRSEVARRTIHIPDYLDREVREHAGEGESFSAAVTRLIEEGLRASGAGKAPSYVGTGAGPSDLGRNAEKYLREIFAGK